jgi:tetratricopeptide (TPR) repeat protein
MRTWLYILLALGGLKAAAVPPVAKAVPPPKEAIPAEEEAIPAMEEAIPPPVKALPAPVAVRFPGGILMAVSAATPAAQQAVLQGLNHLHGGWEFEASRHFAVALLEDPECLLAHWGMVMALLVPNPETGKARNAAAVRMLELLEKGQGTELERGYVYGLIKYLDEGPVSAASAFRKVAKKFPNDLQAAVFAALFGRTGYDEMGTATPSQQQAETELEALVKAHPESPLPLNALLAIRAEASVLAPSLELARKLCQMAPDYAPYHHLLGHYEWRSGEHQAAALAFGRAVMLYENWMKSNQATVADCPEWVKAEAYRVVALATKGDFDTAYAAAKQLAARPLAEDRALSSGIRMLLWEAQTLPARLLMRRGKPGDAALALASLPKPESLKPYHQKCLSFWWIDALRIALEAQRLVETNKLDEARKAVEALTFHGDKMAKAQAVANQNGERSAWNRAFKTMEVLSCELRGRIALQSRKELRGSAFNWFRSAADRQRPAVMLYPPVLLSPELVKLGAYHVLVNEPAAAIQAYQDALKAYPNDMDALQGLQRAYEAAKQPAQAAEVAEKIKRQMAP